MRPKSQYVQASVERSSGAASGTSWIAQAMTHTAARRGGVARATTTPPTYAAKAAASSARKIHAYVESPSGWPPFRGSSGDACGHASRTAAVVRPRTATPAPSAARPALIRLLVVGGGRRVGVVGRRLVRRAAAVLPLPVPGAEGREPVRHEEVRRGLVRDRLLHEEVPDRRRERAACNRDAVHVVHRDLRALVADPHACLELRDVAAEPGVGVILGRAGLA